MIDSKSRAEGGRGMILNCGRLCLDLKNCLHVYAEGSDDKMNKEKLKNKNMHPIFFCSTEFSDEGTYSWLKKGDLKKAAAQEQHHHIGKEDNIFP